MSLSEPNLRDRVIALVAEIRELDPAGVRGSSRLREDLGMDSLSSLELLSALSEETGVDLPIEEAMSLCTIDDACEFVLRMREVDQHVAHAGI